MSAAAKRPPRPGSKAASPDVGGGVSPAPSLDSGAPPSRPESQVSNDAAEGGVGALSSPCCTHLIHRLARALAVQSVSPTLSLSVRVIETLCASVDQQTTPLRAQARPASCAVLVV